MLNLALLLTPGLCLAAVQQAMEQTDLSRVLPLGRQHSLLNSTEVVIKKLGHLMSQYLPEVLQILLCVTASVTVVLAQRDKVSSFTVCSILHQLLKHTSETHIFSFELYWNQFQYGPELK